MNERPADFLLPWGDGKNDFSRGPEGALPLVAKNEPPPVTPDEIEAAASVIWEFVNHEPWDAATPSQQRVYRDAARTALTAAARVQS